MSDKEIKKNKVFLVTYGWPVVTVARDGIGDSKEDKYFGVRELANLYIFKIKIYDYGRELRF